MLRSVEENLVETNTRVNRTSIFILIYFFFKIVQNLDYFSMFFIVHLGRFFQYDMLEYFLIYFKFIIFPSASTL